MTSDNANHMDASKAQPNIGSTQQPGKKSMKSAAPEATTKSSGKQQHKQQRQQHQQSATSGAAKRQQGNSNSNDKAFAHPWHKTTLKGHTGQLFDLSFSADGEYLASCDEGMANFSSLYTQNHHHFHRKLTIDRLWS